MIFFICDLLGNKQYRIKSNNCHVMGSEVWFHKWKPELNYQHLLVPGTSKPLIRSHA